MKWKVGDKFLSLDNRRGDTRGRPYFRRFNRVYEVTRVTTSRRGSVKLYYMGENGREMSTISGFAKLIKDSEMARKVYKGKFTEHGEYLAIKGELWKEN